MALFAFFVPCLTIVTLLVIHFHPVNFTAHGGFAPYGFHGIFAALPAGVVFALQGFEQATQMAGESVNPQKHVAKAIILAMVIGAVVYIGLEIAFVGALDPAKLASGGWAKPIGEGDYGPYYTLAISGGVIWLATVFGMLFLAPAPSWQQLVAVITGATAVMYAFAPISLGALRRVDPTREHPYRLPAPGVMLPLGFVFANLIIYWGGFAVTWKLAIGLAIGQIIFVIVVAARARNVDAKARFRSALWIWPWQAGLIVLGLLGNDGDGALKVLPEDRDALIVALFGVIVYFVVVRTAQPRAEVERTVEADLLDETMGHESRAGVA